jgi:hypothetical protein
VDLLAGPDRLAMVSALLLDNSTVDLYSVMQSHITNDAGLSTVTKSRIQSSLVNFAGNRPLHALQSTVAAVDRMADNQRAGTSMEGAAPNENLHMHAYL